jgi:hypothetical protein
MGEIIRLPQMIEKDVGKSGAFGSIRWGKCRRLWGSSFDAGLSFAGWAPQRPELDGRSNGCASIYTTGFAISRLVHPVLR